MTNLNKLSLSRIAVVGLSVITVAIAGCQTPVSETAPIPESSADVAQSASESTDMAQASPVRVGEPAPGFTGIDSNGTSHTLSDFRGRTVVLEWTNHQCPYTVKHYESGNMQALQKEATDNDVVWLSIVSSASGLQGHVTPEQANELTTSRNASPTAVILDPDGKIGTLYTARTTPHMYVIDADGVLQYMGAIDDKPTSNQADIAGAKNYVGDALTSVLANQPVAVASTQPYGCTVKYGS